MTGYAMQHTPCGRGPVRAQLARRPAALEEVREHRGVSSALRRIPRGLERAGRGRAREHGGTRECADLKAA